LIDKNPCNGKERGKCDPETSRCECDWTKYYGKNCEFKYFDCRDNDVKCSGETRGTCDSDFGVCTCKDGFEG